MFENFRRRAGWFAARLSPAVRLVVCGWLVVQGIAAAGAAEWQAVSKKLLAENKTGFGGASGVAVERKTGDVYLWLSDQGLYRSADRGETWQLYAGHLKGRTELPGCLQIVSGEKGPRVIAATVYGGPIVTTSGGDSPEWKTLAKESGHVDWCATAFEQAAPKFWLALKHESGDELLVSHDGGQKFTSLGKQFGPAAVLDDQTAVVIRGDKEKRHPERTTDGGTTFAPCGEFRTKAVPQWFEGKCYWLTESAILTTPDQGASWREHCKLADGRFGPVFGRDGQQMFVLTGKGIVETGDGGKTWSAPLPLPAEVKAGGALVWIAYDPVHRSLYAMQMGSQLYRLERE